MKNFFNSNKERGQQLAASEKKALTQNELILKFFKDHPNSKYTAWEVDLVISIAGTNWPLTSIRRAITSMAMPKSKVYPMGGLLEETGEMKAGGYGKPNRVYRITKKGLNYKR